nr:hypothetical protein [Bradyrhizobium sp. IC4061]
MDEANGPAAEMVCFSSRDREYDAYRIDLADLPIAIFFQRPIDCMEGEDEPMTGQDWQRQSRWSKGPPFERQRKSMSCPQTNLEIAIERQVDSNR